MSRLDNGSKQFQEKQSLLLEVRTDRPVNTFDIFLFSSILNVLLKDIFGDFRPGRLLDLFPFSVKL